MYRRFVKRWLDVVAAICALPVLALAVLVVGPIVHFSDGGPVFYAAPRLGRNGRIFRMLKVRTMKVNCPDIRNENGSTYNAPDDPRLTRVGRFLRESSVDEIPQILNVLAGDMSVVGPRPDLPDQLRHYTQTEVRRLEAQPGITGLAQVSVRNSVSWKERLRFDTEYVDNVSLQLDCKVLLRTVRIVLSARGVYSVPAPTNEAEQVPVHG